MNRDLYASLYHEADNFDEIGDIALEVLIETVELLSDLGLDEDTIKELVEVAIDNYNKEKLSLENSIGQPEQLTKEEKAALFK